MFKSFISLRYLRARRTNLIGVSGIFVGVAALILILSIMTGFLEENRRIVRGSLADILISPSAFGDYRPPERPERILEHVRQDPRVAGACAQLIWFGMLTQPGMPEEIIDHIGRRSDLPGVQLVGIDFEDEFSTTQLRETLERESQRGDSRVEDPDDPFALPPFYSPQNGRPRDATVILGEQLFHQMVVGRRGREVDILTVLHQGGDIVPVNKLFVVAGTFRSRENEMDLDRVYMRRSDLADLLGAQYSQILVRLHDYDRDGEAVCDDLRKSLAAEGLISPTGGPWEVRTWEDERQTILGAIENEKSLMAIMLSLVLLVAGFTVFAILSMLVTEKRRDIGILTALGATRSGILWVFLMIGFWDALFGALLGALAGWQAAVHINGIERWLSRLSGFEIFNREVYYFDHIPSVVEPLSVALIVLGAFVCTLLFAALPAIKAARLHPIDALRYE